VVLVVLRVFCILEELLVTTRYQLERATIQQAVLLVQQVQEVQLVLEAQVVHGLGEHRVLLELLLLVELFMLEELLDTTQELQFLIHIQRAI
jgi:hypothetical protein